MKKVISRPLKLFYALPYRISMRISDVKKFQTRYQEDDFELIGKLGQGSTSQAFLSYNILTKQKKVMKLFKLIPEEKILREIKINRKISQIYHNYTTDAFPIVRMTEIIKNKGCGAYGCIFEYMPGAPLNLMPKAIVKKEKFKYMKQILEGLKMLHQQSIIHRDLKPSNILITPQGAKLFDFGLSKIKGYDELKTNRFGTKCYYPPEVVFRMPKYSQKIDIWTAGVIFAELLTNKKPIMPYSNDLETISQVLNLCEFDESSDGSVIDDRYREFIPKNRNRNKSFSSYFSKNFDFEDFNPDESLEDKQVVSTVKKMLRINPLRRPSAQQALTEMQGFFEDKKL